MLVGKFKIESDSMNVTVLEKAKTNTGKVYYRPLAYFPFLKDALKYLVDQKVSETKLKDFKTVVRKQDKLYDLIERKVK